MSGLIFPARGQHVVSYAAGVCWAAPVALAQHTPLGSRTKAWSIAELTAPIRIGLSPHFFTGRFGMSLPFREPGISFDFPDL